VSSPPSLETHDTEREGRDESLGLTAVKAAELDVAMGGLAQKRPRGSRELAFGCCGKVDQEHEARVREALREL
jgi:hypothetical protein